MKSKLFLAIGLSIVLSSFFTACQREVMTDPQMESGLDTKTEQLLAEQFSSYERVQYDHDALYEKLQNLAEGAPADIVLPRNNTTEPWVLHLTRNGVVQDDFRGTLFDGKNTANTAPLGIRTFQGAVEGGGIVALTISPTMISGVIEKGSESWTLEPIQKYDQKAKGLAIAYREQDMLARPAGNYCAEAPLPAGAAQRSAPGGSPDPVMLAANCWQIETMVHGDRQYLLQVGGNTNTALFLMIAAINNASSRFASINIHLFVPSGSAIQNINPDNMPYDAYALLNHIIWIDNSLFPNAARDITLFFTGRNMSANGSYGIAGLAKSSTLCANKTLSYAVAETINGFYNNRIQAHEIGHMIGAPHDGGCSGGLMYPYSNASCAGDYPSTTSKNQINAHIWYNHACIQMAAGC